MTDYSDLIQAAIVIIMCMVPLVTVWVLMLCWAIHDLADVLGGIRTDAQAQFRMLKWKGGR